MTTKTTKPVSNPNSGAPAEIDVVIDASGNITSTVLNVAGPSCSALVEFLHKMGEVEVDEHTPDFFLPPAERTTLAGTGRK